MRDCPKCESKQVHRSRTRNRFEVWRREITRKLPYRCHACGWRGWGVDTGPRFKEEELEMAAQSLAPSAPNLKDTTLAPMDGPFTKVKLERLDHLEPTGDND